MAAVGAAGGQGFDWPVLMRAGLHGLGLRPAEFWALTPAELSVLLGAGARPAMGRARLDEMMARWPDRAPERAPERGPEGLPERERAPGQAAGRAPLVAGGAEEAGHDG